MQAFQINTDKQLNNMLARRGLRFSISDGIPKQQKVSIGSIIWIIINSLLPNFLFWFAVLYSIRLDVYQSVISSLIVSACQSFIAALLSYIAQGVTPIVRSLQAKFNERRNGIYLSRHQKPFKKTLLPLWTLIAILINIALELGAISFGIKQAEGFTSRDISLGINVFVWSFSYEKMILFLIVLTILNIIISALFGLSINQSRNPRTRKRVFITTIFYSTINLSFQWIVLLISALAIKKIQVSISTILVIIAAQNLLPIYLVTAYLLALISAAITSLPSLLRFRATVLGIAFLAATIPFLNSDSWQLMSTLKWQDLITAGFIIYSAPILLLMFAQKDLIIKEWKSLWNKNVTPDKLVSVLRRDGLIVTTDLTEMLTTQIELFNANSKVNTPIKYKYTLKSLLFFLVLPLAVFIFAYILFTSLIHDQILSQWVMGYGSGQASFFISIWGLLRIKAAIFLALLSTTSTIGSLLASKEDLINFLRESFLFDLQTDKYLLVLSGLSNGFSNNLENDE